MKKILIIVLIICFSCIMTDCATKNDLTYDKYSYEFLGVFDTTIQFMGYAKTQDEFETMCKLGQNRLIELDRLFNIYKGYEGINNIKTINENAGIKPVEVEQEIIDLLSFCKEWYKKTNQKCNIAFGPVLSIWHRYREAGLNNPENAELPSISELQAANEYTDINKIVIDTEKRTVYLEDKSMSIDVGAVAKGFASKIVAQELKDMGYTSFILSSGGNVVAVGKPIDKNRKSWGIGIQNPDGNAHIPNDEPLDVIYGNDFSVVTSGDYQRYYIVDGKKYHHLIDPATLMPSNYYRSVVVVSEDSAIADFMSTTLFLSPYEEGIKLAESVGVEAVWVMKDNTIKSTKNIKSKMKNIGGASNSK
jgi:thiamine biosynthesis lipoprotein